jgi:hypothetical protein
VREVGEKKLLSLGFNTPNGQNHETAWSSKAVIFALLSILLIPAFQGVHNQESEFSLCI